MVDQQDSEGFVMASASVTAARMKNKVQSVNPVHYFTLAIFVFVAIFPFWWMYVVASNDQSVLAHTPPPIKPGPNLGKTIKTVYEFVNFNRAIATSFFISTILAAAQVFFCSFAG